MSAFQRWTLTAVALATAILILDIAVVNTALSTLARDLDAGFHDLKWVVDAYTLALASVVLTAGALADRAGRRRSFAVGVTVFTLSSVAAAAAGTIELLIAARAVQGVGAAIMFAVSLALLANAFPGKAERGGALAVYGASIGGAFAAGPLVGGLLTETLGWRAVFLINLPIGIAVLAITARSLRESRDRFTRRVDLPGQLTLIAGLFLLVSTLLRAGDDGWGSTGVLAGLGGAAAFLAGFVAIEARSRTPMMPLALFREPRFAGAQLVSVAISAGLFAAFIYLMLYLQQVLGMSAVEAGLTLVPGGVANVLASGATARLAGRVPAGALIAAGLGLVAAGMLLLAGVETDSTWLSLQPGIVTALIGLGLFNPAVSAVALDVPERHSGLAAGINDTARQAGMAIGIAALGTLIPTGAALGGDPAAFVDGLRDAQLAGAALAAAGAGAALLLIHRPFPSRRLAIEPA